MEGQDILVRVEQLKRELQNMGCEIREDWLGGKECAVCEVRGKRVVFVDLGNPPSELAGSLQRVVDQLNGREKQRTANVGNRWDPR